MRTRRMVIHIAIILLGLLSALIVNILSLRILKFNPVIFVVPITVFVWSLVLRRRRQTRARTLFRTFGISFLVSSVISYLILIALVIAALQAFT